MSGWRKWPGRGRLRAAASSCSFTRAVGCSPHGAWRRWRLSSCCGRFRAGRQRVLRKDQKALIEKALARVERARVKPAPPARRLRREAGFPSLHRARRILRPRAQLEVRNRGVSVGTSFGATPELRHLSRVRGIDEKKRLPHSLLPATAVWISCFAQPGHHAAQYTVPSPARKMLYGLVDAESLSGGDESRRGGSRGSSTPRQPTPGRLTRRFVMRGPTGGTPQFHLATRRRLLTVEALRA